jgi:hypothetical protein
MPEVAPDAATQGFVQAVLQEFTWPRLLTMQLLVLILVAMHVATLPSTPGANSSLSFLVSAVIIAEFEFNSALLAAVCGHEAVRRGGRAWLVYPLVMIAAALFAVSGQWEVRSPFQLRVAIDDWDPSAPFRRYGHMLIMASETLAYAATITLVYTNRKRELDCVVLARMADLRRAQLERDLTTADLASVQARIDPEQMIRSLVMLQRLYQQCSPLAEPKLDELVGDLRARTRVAANAAKLSQEEVRI